MALFSDNDWDTWIKEYASSHEHPINRACHAVGIPMIALSIILALPAFFVPVLWYYAVALFVVGWIFQFVGHVFERKPPEFFKDWRFLFVGLRWWAKKFLQRKV